LPRPHGHRQNGRGGEGAKKPGAVVFIGHDEFRSLMKWNAIRETCPGFRVISIPG
jgi:hypothetical protein